MTNSTVVHDEGWLAQTAGFLTSNRSYQLDLVGMAKSYHEYMMRWRPMSEAPNAGDWIEVLCNRMGDIHTITYGPARFNESDLGWRPASPLPEPVK